MQRRMTRNVPWAVLALQLLLLGAYLTLVWLIARTPVVEVVLAYLLGVPTFVALTAVGALIVARAPGNRFGWLCAGLGISWMLQIVASGYSAYSFGVHRGDLPGSQVMLWLGSWMF